MNLTLTRERDAQAAELARVSALLYQEKLRAMAEERAALACRRRALAVEQQEAAERVRLNAARTAAEEHRLAAAACIEKARQQEQEARAAAAVAAARVHEVNAYAEKRDAMTAAAEETVADSFRYAAQIAAQLAAAAPKPEAIATALTAKTEAAAIPVFREHQVGGVKKPTLATSPLRAHAPNGAQLTEKSGGGADNSPPAAQRQARLCYALPFVYEGTVVDYRPTRSFNTTTGGVKRSSRRGRDTHVLLSAPEPPELLAAKREGTGTEYYDPSRNHFFAGEWRDDKRSGAGVLSLPTSAVQGTWRDDRLTGSAVVQTQHAKANAAFSSAVHRPPASSFTTAAAGGEVQRGATGDGTLKSVPPHHVALNGGAVVELDNNSLFVGSLHAGRVGAPYVLQLGEGDLIEWLGVPPRGEETMNKRRQGTKPLTQNGTAFLPVRQTPSFLSGAASAAGTGECRLRFHNGDTYVGHVRDFQLHGTGYYRFAADGQSFTGHFRRGLPDGEGLLIFANGDLYKGGFARGVFDGFGSFVCEAGHYVYEGHWKEGVMSGSGKVLYANGDVWEGTFHDNERVCGAYTRVT